jgi:hypothetical protein
MSSRRWVIEDWKQIDTYIHHKHQDVAAAVIHLCCDIAMGLGTANRSKYKPYGIDNASYQDDVVHIEMIGTGYVKVILTKTKIEVMDAGINHLADYHDDHVNCYTFRVGSWIDHILSFKSIAKQKVEQLQLEQFRLQEQDEQSRFGRLE